MNKKRIIKLKATILLTLLLTINSKEVSALSSEQVNLSIIKIGNPLFYDDLYNDLIELPIGIKNYLSLNNLNIRLLENPYGADLCWQDIYGYYYDNPIKGFINIDDDIATIYVEASFHPGYYETYNNISKDFTEKQFNYRIAKATLFHELGHFFDAKTNFELSNSDTFKKFYNTEINTFLNTTLYKIDNLGIYGNISNTREYFASAYSCYILYPEELQEKCPLTYEYINYYMRMINDEYEKIDDNTCTKTKFIDK